MKTQILAFVTLALALPAPAQQELDTPAIIARVRDGGRFEDTKFRRGDDGSLELHYFADIGVVPGGMRYQPLLGKNLERGFQSAGSPGFVSMICHGPNDLLSMTDAEFHLGALGVDTSDVGLRQYLALSPPSFEGDRGRAELLDRMLAIDLLVRRGCKSAAAEMQAIVRAELPVSLRARAKNAIARFAGGTEALQRRRLAAETLNLPLTFDGCVIIDHARLPDLGWLTPLARRAGMLVTASKIQQAGGALTAPQANGAQALSDVVGELPFGLALRYGNVRFDHSCVMIHAKADPEMPVALSWQAVGEFEHEGREYAEVAERLVRDNPLLSGELTVTANALQATFGGGAGKPRPKKAAELLRGEGYAIRAIVPKTSKLWPALRFLDLPAAMGGELRITFGDPGVIVLMVEARDEEDAQEWVDTGKELLGQLKANVERELPDAVTDNEDFMRLLDAFFGAAFSVKDSAAFAVVELKGVTPRVIQSLVKSSMASRF